MDNLILAQIVRDSFTTFETYKDVNFKVHVNGKEVRVNIGQEAGKQQITVTLYYRRGWRSVEPFFIVTSYEPITIAQLIVANVY